MATNRLHNSLLAALGVTLLASAALAQEKSSMTAPPWGDDAARITFGEGDQGQLQLQYKGQFRFTSADLGSGTEGTDRTSSLGFRRNRLALMGGWGDKFSLYVQTEFTEDLNIDALGVAGTNAGTNFQMLDAVARFNLSPAFKVNVGKFKYNLSRENLESCEDPLTLDRSLFIRAAYVGTRDQGINVWGNLFGGKVQYRADLMEGRKAVGGATAPSSSLRFGGRAHVSLFDSETSYGYKGTYLGDKKVFTLGAAVQHEPGVTYVDTITQLGEKDYTAWTADAFLEYPLGGSGTLTASAAYEDVSLDGAYQGANPDAGSTGLNGEKNGWYAKGGYLLPSVPLQVFGRYEKWRFACLHNVFDQIVDWYGFGVNYYIWRQNLKLTAEFSKTDFDVEGTFSNLGGTSRTSKDFTTVVAQVQLIF